MRKCRLEYWESVGDTCHEKKPHCFGRDALDERDVIFRVIDGCIVSDVSAACFVCLSAYVLLFCFSSFNGVHTCIQPQHLQVILLQEFRNGSKNGRSEERAYESDAS